MKTRPFSVEALKTASKLTFPPLETREQVLGFTIDSESSKDLDDAIWCEIRNNGAVISIHIADVTSVIPLGSPLDRDVYQRIETRYLKSGNDPMLPHELSEDKLSILEGQIRPTLTVRVTLNQQAEIEDVELKLTRLCSLKRFSYQEADAQMKQPGSYFFQMLRYCDTWAQKLNWKRSQLGALGGTTLGGLFLNEEGKPEPAQPYRSQQIIQEFMLLANTAIANLAEKHQIVMLYRNHTTSALAPSQQEMAAILASLGMPELIKARLSAWMNAAIYSATAIGHFALSVPAYTHITSPIRRLADYINHRILKAVLLEGKESPYTRDELVNFAEEINKYREQVKNETDEFFAQQRQQQAARMLKNQGQLQQLSEKEFSQLIKNAARMEKLDALISVALERLNQDKLKPLDLYYLTFFSTAEQEELRCALVEHFNASPIIATQVIQIASQQERKATEYIEDKSADGRFALWCVWNQKTTALPAVGTSKQSTKHLSSVFWLEGFFSDRLVSLEERVISWEGEVFSPQATELIDGEESPRALLVGGGNFEDYDEEYDEYELLPCGDNPIGYLNEKLPLIGVGIPKYKFQPSNDGWQCICSVSYFNEIVAETAEGKNKKEAKQKAALYLVAKLDALDAFATLP